MALRYFKYFTTRCPSFLWPPGRGKLGSGAMPIGRSIERDIAVIAPSAVGREMTIIVEVVLEREDRRTLDAFKRRMRTAPGVQQCYYTTGEADFILIMTVRDIREYEAFTQEYFFDQSNISKFNTSIVMDRVKVSLDVL